ncbi:MAG: hypothetical protein ACI9C2_002687, partial [Gammaproteobacteria bacterium]
TIGYERIRLVDPEFSGSDDLYSLDAFALPQFQRPDSGEVDGEQVGISAMRRNALLKAAKENDAAIKALDEEAMDKPDTMPKANTPVETTEAGN